MRTVKKGNLHEESLNVYIPHGTLVKPLPPGTVKILPSRVG